MNSQSDMADRVMSWSRPVIAVFAILVYTISFYIAWMSGDKSQQSLLTGSIMTIMATIVGYYFGSSSGSQKKDDALAASVAKKDDLLAATLPAVAPKIEAPLGATGATGTTGGSPP